MTSILETKKALYPKSTDYVLKNLVYNENNTECLRCNRCNAPILNETNIKGYPYQCILCDENMYNIETHYGNLPSDEELYNLIEITNDILMLDMECENTITKNYEVVEVCPHCDHENIYKENSEFPTEYTAICQNCGKEIFLCDECFHSEDNPEMCCSWHEKDGCNICFRGCIK